MKALILIMIICEAGCEMSSGDERDGEDKVELFTITEIFSSPDGIRDVKVHTMTSEQIAENQRRLDVMRAQNINPYDFEAGQVVCSPTSSSVHLYDNTLVSCRFGCNQICFNVTDLGSNRNVYLGNYCHTKTCTESWNSLVRSYWTGSLGYFLWRDYGLGDNCAEYFASSLAYYDAGGCGQNSNYLVFRNGF